MVRGRSRGDSVSATICKCILLLVTTKGLVCDFCFHRNLQQQQQQQQQQGVSLGGLFCEALLLRIPQRVALTRDHRCALAYNDRLPRCSGVSRPTRVTIDCRLSLDNIGDEENDNEDDESSAFDAKALSNRIQQVKDSESQASEIFTSGLEQRVRELRSAKAIEEKLGSEEEELLSLPVICFDALLPNQKLEGSTEDTTFIRFLLEETGLGGWFVMTSFEYRSRKVRRNGVLCKVEFLDAAAASPPSLAQSDSKTRLPTSVDFVIVGKRRCRLAGRGKGLESRIGRWRRAYDENGEESVLGWGMERFTDLLPSNADDRGLEEQSSSMEEEDEEAQTTNSIADPKQWSNTKIQVLHNRERGEESSSSSKEFDSVILEKAESLVPLLEEWQGLASNPDTYRNSNVTASVRVRRNQPVLKVDPKALLKRALAPLGDRPDPRIDPTGFCFWGAALINPLPALGVSLEIRGNLLEVRTLKERLKILETGLVRSIQNLKGERPL